MIVITDTVEDFLEHISLALRRDDQLFLEGVFFNCVQDPLDDYRSEITAIASAKVLGKHTYSVVLEESCGQVQFTQDGSKQALDEAEEIGTKIGAFCDIEEIGLYSGVLREN